MYVHSINLISKLLTTTTCIHYNICMKSVDLAGQRFTRLLVLEQAPRKNGRVQWKCRCDCGKITCVDTRDLLRGTTKSCGCYNRDRIAKLQAVHGQAHSRLYSVWKDIRRRCNNNKHKDYCRYGALGVHVCEEWNKSFIPFYEWSMSHGYDPNAEYGKCTIDRMDPNGDYSPENCRWVTLREQANNRRNTLYLTYNGVTDTMSNWAKNVGAKYGVTYLCLFDRIHDRGWSIEKALTTPPRSGKRKPKEPPTT